MKWIPGTQTVLQGSEDKILRVWDMRTCTPTLSFPVDQYFPVCFLLADVKQISGLIFF